MGAPTTARSGRRQARREKILTAAADLIASRGYHAVSMADIGAAAGIVGPGIYRHFGSKSAMLAALFDQVIDRLLANIAEAIGRAQNEHQALSLLMADQVALVIENRELALVYHREIHNLPTEDRRQLGRKQRLYLEEWVHVVSELRRELDEAEVRTLVQAAISAIQSVLHHRHSGLPEERIRTILTTVGYAVLGVTPSDEIMPSDPRSDNPIT